MKTMSYDPRLLYAVSLSTGEGIDVEASGKIPRRTFIHGTAAVAAISALPLSMARPAFASASAAGATLAKVGPPLKRSTFMALQGSTFRLMSEGHHHFDVVLSEINDLDPTEQTNDEDRFSLVFSAPANRPRVQGIQTFRNANVGDLVMFVAPIDRGKRALRLESIFNSL
jgi:hypothetical protein